MHTPTKGAIRLKSAPLSPAVPVKLAEIQADLADVRTRVSTESPLWYLADAALYAVSLALRKIETDRLLIELDGQATGTGGRP